jgi:spore maturation protein CgeB
VGRDILIVGQRTGSHIGGSLERAALAAGLGASVVDSSRAFHAARWRRYAARVLVRRPPRLAAFNREVTAAAAAARPRVLITAGFGPVTATTLRALAASGTRRVCWLTDDPWAPGHRARWLLEALPHYDLVCTPRRANLAQLQALGCKEVRYLPFAYDPELSFPETLPLALRQALGSQVLFVGGADADRVPIIRGLLRARLNVALYGGFWHRYRETKAAARGLAAPDVIRQATAAADINLCLVRRSNRDGHVMRSFEIAAAGGCALMEETQEHHELFGAEGEAALYFASMPELIDKARALLADAGLRRRLARAARERVLGRGHTYRDRLEVLLGGAVTNS